MNNSGKGQYGWAHVRTHKKHACFFAANQVVMHNGCVCSIISTKTSVPVSRRPPIAAAHTHCNDAPTHDTEVMHATQ